MTLNRTAIEWCDMTWNPVTGCLHGCDFCYARKIAKRFKGTKAFLQGFAPTFHPDRLHDPVKMKKPQVIFVVSMGDLFGDWVPEDWINQTINACLKAPQHTYIFLTKNPSRMMDVFALYPKHSQYPVQKNFWLGTSCGEDIESWDRISQLRLLGQYYDGWNTFLSIEPLKVMYPYDPSIVVPYFDWFIVGTQTNPASPPLYDVVKSIVNIGKKNQIPVFLKDSIKECFPDIEILRQFPAGMHALKPKKVSS